LGIVGLNILKEWISFIFQGLVVILQEEPVVHRCSVTYQKTGTLDYTDKETSELAQYN
jgi:hypothetical protein